MASGIATLAAERDRQILRYVYTLACTCSFFMVAWILVLPSSWLCGRWKFHDDFLMRHLDPQNVSPPDVLFKFEGHTAIHLTHILPSALWSLLIPFQLNPSFRKNNPKLHRRLGYVFLGSALLVFAGIGIILQRGLLFENQFPDLPPQDYNYTTEFLSLLAFYFLGSAVHAVNLARQKRFAGHQRWIIRHIASGIWIALQRILLCTVYHAIYPKPVAREVQRNSFGQSGSIAIALTLALGEYTIRLLDKKITKSSFD